jgi:hypothetical protein
LTRVGAVPAPGLARKLADSSDTGSFASHARRKRFAELQRRFPDLADMSVLDLGGTPGFWETASTRPRHVTVVNLDDIGESSGGLEVIHADACELPETITTRDYDLTFSNSLIEHLGGHQRRSRFARQVRDLAPHYWVQTPYRYFPFEPHWVFPGQQFLPAKARAYISRTWTRGHIHSDATTAVDDVLWIELLSVTELCHYFPDGDLYRERFAGLTKSITVVR